MSGSTLLAFWFLNSQCYITWSNFIFHFTGVNFVVCFVNLLLWVWHKNAAEKSFWKLEHVIMVLVAVF